MNPVSISRFRPHPTKNVNDGALMSDNARIMCRRLPTLLAAVSSIMMLALILCACGDGYASNPEDKEADPATVEPRIHAMVGNAADCFD